MSVTNWSREQVEELLRTERFRYQRVELPYGLATEGRDRNPTAKQIFPADMTGRSVLDIGCSHGFFCFEAAKRGATRVVGLDVEEDVIRKNHLLADCLNLKVEFKVQNVEKHPVVEQFDYVLCLNVLHHVINPLSVLQNLIEATRERLVLEMAAFGAHDRRRLRLFPFYGHLLSLAPIIYVSRGGSSRGRELKRYFLTKHAVCNILQYHHRLFAKVEFKPSEHKNRYIVVADRQKILNLIMVAGPTAAGKSTFCDLFLNGKLPDVYERIGIDPRREEVIFTSPRVSDIPPTPILSNALFHYDVLRPYMRSARVYSRDEALDVLTNAEKVIVITLWTSPERLRYQLKQSSRKPFKWLSKRERKIQSDYEEPSRLIEHYQAWFDFIRPRSGKLVIVDQSAEQQRFLTYDEWRLQAESLIK